ncbi:MAG: hypothetical protein U0271_11880 [Polyangiaceae bacterium]
MFVQQALVVITVLGAATFLVRKLVLPQRPSRGPDVPLDRLVRRKRRRPPSGGDCCSG